MTDINERIARSKLQEVQFNAAIEAAFRAHQAEDLLRSAEKAARAHNRRMVWIVVGVSVIVAVVTTLIAVRFIL